MLSFVFFADGPCNEASWHVNDDKNQWWSRRDALVRITSTSVWMRPGTSNAGNGVVGDSAYLFRVQNEANPNKSTKATVCNDNISYSSPVIVHSGKILASRIHTPTERNLLKLWKDAFSKAAKAQLRICLSGSASNNGGSSTSGVLCNNDAWGELAFQQTAAFKCDTAGSTTRSTIDTTKLDKRELLKLLQHSCSVDFLRKHGLNGSEALILKKKNRDTVLAAYNDWNQSESTDLAQKSTGNYDASFQRLVDTCKVVLAGILHRASTLPSASPVSGSPTGYLLFLHEDYAQELNIFHPQREKRAFDIPIVCAMGAVRDALEVEVRAMIEAANSLGMLCVGANLGRTAEFTSKIVTALVSHAIERRLFAAVSELTVISAPINSPNSNKTALNCIEKLAPMRKGGWTWDGSSNKTAHHKRKFSSTDDEKLQGPGEDPNSKADCDYNKKSNIQVAQHHMYIVGWLSILPEEVTDDQDHRERMHGLIQLVISSLWRSRLASEVAAATQPHEDTQSKNPQALDTRPTNTKKHNPHASIDQNEDDSTVKVVPVLYLVFKDGRVACLTQLKLAVAMANQHMAAPSEYQVLQMLKQLLSDSSVYCCPPLPATTRDSPLKSVLQCILPKKLSKRERKAVRVVTLSDTTEICCNSCKGASLQASVSDDKSIKSLSEFAYYGYCTCVYYNNSITAGKCSDSSVPVSSRYDIVILINPPSLPMDYINTTTQIASDEYLNCLYEFVYPDKTLPIDRKKLIKKVGNMSFLGPLHGPDGGNIAPYLAVTTLQHFAYHDRLYVAIDEGAKNISISL